MNADTTDVLSVSFADVTDKNLFAYCDNNPITRADAGGAVWHIVAGAVIGFASSFVTSVAMDLIFEQEVDWKGTLISGGFGALSGGLIAAFPAGAVFINSGLSAIESVVQDSRKGASLETTIINMSISAGFGAITGSWGSDFADANIIDDAVGALPKTLKGNHPRVKTRNLKIVKKACRFTGKAYLRNQIEDISMGLIEKGTQKYVDSLVKMI